MTLQQIFERHDTDKAAHGYAAVYEKLPQPRRILEVGVFKGASLMAWREWWLDARVIGLDDFARGTQPDPNELNTIRADSRTWEAPPQWMETFQLLIDDGSHRPRDQAATLRNLWPLLAPGGRYCIEDVLPIDTIGWDNLPPWFAHPSRRDHFTIAAFFELADAIAATGGKMTRHDFRAQSGKPDSVLVEIRKP